MSENDKKSLAETIKEIAKAIKSLIAYYKQLEVETGLNPLKDLGMEHPVYRLYRTPPWGDKKLIRAIFVNENYAIVRNNSNDKVIVKEWAQSVEEITVIAVRIYPKAVYVRGFIVDEHMGVAYFKV